MPAEPFRPSAYECSLLVLHLLQSWAGEKDSTPTRFRLSELTLKRVCCRPRLHPDFLIEMQDWLIRAGWAFFFAGSSFGVVKLEAVESWTRLGSKRIAQDLDAVANGEFDFAPLQRLAQAASTTRDD